MKISYAITVCNEFIEIQKLLPLLLNNKRQQDEIVVLVDLTKNKPTSELLGYLHKLSYNDKIILVEDRFNNHFADWTNKEADVILVPRINTVEGLTQEHIEKWRWKVDEKGWVNFPDYQWRIWKNKPEIEWINKVHERLNGFKSYITLPAVPLFCLNHPKKIKRQEEQNKYYETL